MIQDVLIPVHVPCRNKKSFQFSPLPARIMASASKMSGRINAQVIEQNLSLLFSPQFAHSPLFVSSLISILLSASIVPRTVGSSSSRFPRAFQKGTPTEHRSLQPMHYLQRHQLSTHRYRPFSPPCRSASALSSKYSSLDSELKPPL